MTMKRLLLTATAIAVIAVAMGGFRLMTSSRESNIDWSKLATPNNPLRSPSGRYLLEIHEEILGGVKSWRFTISPVADNDSRPMVVFTSPDAFRTRDALFMLWGDNDQVWVYSGDVGTFFWEQASDSDWQKHAVTANSSVPIPPLLKQLKPRDFGNKS